MKLLGLCGSLRATSSSKRLLRAIEKLLPPGSSWASYEGLATLPAFNPDLDEEGSVPPAPVAELRRCLRDCDALVISTPEYAHGIPGSLKNGLDWVVSSGELNRKPVAVIVPGGGEHAMASLTETLRTMDADVREAACLNVPNAGKVVDAQGQVLSPQLAEALTESLAALAAPLSAD
jgi:NAD(P)H-dependent FMN reductase